MRELSIILDQSVLDARIGVDYCGVSEEHWVYDPDTNNIHIAATAALEDGISVSIL